ncbi:MAG TPA: Wzz/FepE/Etk N-terminal domain-containing protein [Candidatus Dormibacteraeota bacterium]|nr:Wzz/FepE/Etk N-terminal domain-containing protein [Candidatus Dormibacteraeota bacterium]
MLGHRELTIDDYLEILRRRYWILLVAAILGALGSYFFSRTLPNQYQSKTLVLVQQPKVNQTFVTPVVDEQIDERLASMTEQILSTAQLEPVVQQYGLYKKEMPKSSLEGRAQRLRTAIKVTPAQPITESQLAGVPGFTVSVTLGEPRVAQEVCAQVASMFLKDNALWRAQAAQDTTEFLAKQIGDAKQALDEQDAKLTAFKMQYLGKLPDQEQMNMNMLTSYNSQLEAVTEALNRTQQDKVNMESQLAQEIAGWQATRTGSNQLTLEKQMADLENKLVILRAQYTDDFPDVVKVKSDIAHLQKLIAASKASNAAAASSAAGSDTPAYAEPPQILQLRQQIRQYDQIIQDKIRQQAGLQKTIREYQARVQLSPIVDQQFAKLTRNYQTALEFYRKLLTKQSTADMGADLERRQQAEDFQVIEPASFSPTPSSPNRLLFGGGGLLGGLCLGMAIALWLEIRDKAIRTERDIEFYLQVPTLALVPMIDMPSQRQKKYLPPGETGEGGGVVRTLEG